MSCIGTDHSPSCQGSVCQRFPSSEPAESGGCWGRSRGSHTACSPASPVRCSGAPGWGRLRSVNMGWRRVRSEGVGGVRVCEGV